MSTDTDIHALTGAYAVDALPEDEARFFEAHLEECEACRQEVAELRATAARLGEGVAEPAPPELRDRVLAEIDTVRQEPARPSRDHGEQRSPRRWREALVAAAAAVTIIIVGLTAVVANLNARLDRMEQQASSVYEVLASDAVTTIELRTTDEGDGPAAKAIVAPDREQAILLAEGLPRLEGDKVYELWKIGEAGPVPAGTFDAGSEGRVVHLFEGEISGVEQLAVTVEPAGGSLQPTTEPVLVGEVRASA